MTTGWHETAQGWEQVEDVNDGLSATRGFSTGLSTAGTLPTLRDPHPDFSALQAHRIRKVKAQNSSEMLALVTYGPEVDDPNSSFSALTRRWRISGEFLSVPSQSNYFFKSDGGEVAQDVFRRIINEVYTITQIVSSQDMRIGSSAGIHYQVLRTAGRLNSSAWEGLGKGDWMYLGADIDETFTSSGIRQFKTEHQFASRIIEGSSEGWQRVWNESAGIWDQISDSGAFNEDGQLYSFRSFTNLFA